MEKDQLESLLSNVFGHLNAEKSSEKKQWDEGIPLLAKSLLIQDSQEIQEESFSFENSELFFRKEFPRKRLSSLGKRLIKQQ
ncbi:hypothetical protein V8V91_26515 [Algoriphagus halophilus]|uniref:hypothetical protein n=1 Tax=Algoriphagus halophilus TaxID=226505 RepID=UPI00358E3904